VTDVLKKAAAGIAIVALLGAVAWVKLRNRK
jgi:hypothetical protein